MDASRGFEDSIRATVEEHAGLYMEGKYFKFDLSRDWYDTQSVSAGLR